MAELLGMERAALPTSTIGEVRYPHEGSRLTVAVGADLSDDSLLSDVLTDILVTAPQRAAAIREIYALGERVGLDVRIEHDGEGDAVVIGALPT
jgi:hypothetical protein